MVDKKLLRKLNEEYLTEVVDRIISTIDDVITIEYFDYSIDKYNHVFVDRNNGKFSLEVSNGCIPERIKSFAEEYLKSK